MIFKALVLSLILLSGSNFLISQEIPKREFRGAWIHTVGNEYFKTVPADSIKALFIKTLDELMMKRSELQDQLHLLKVFLLL
jgi:hypothetical protein